MIYFNVAGLSPFNRAVQQEVIATLNEFSRLLYSNEGIRYYRETLQRCRKDLAQWLQVENPQHFAFVPNATTACSLILSRITWQPEDTIITTNHENATVLKEISTLQARGIQIETIDPRSPEELLIQIEQLLTSTQVRAILISHVSHIDGRIFPIECISQLCRKHQTLLIVDGAQAVGHIPVNFHECIPDAYFFPGHKWCAGPMGTAALLIGNHFTKGKEPYTPCSANFELGTQNIGLIAGFAKACLIKQHDGLQSIRLKQKRENLRQKLLKMSQFKILEWDGPHSPGILSLQGKETDRLLRSQAPNISWKTFQLPNTEKTTGIRLSWSSDTSEADLEALLTFFQTMNQ